MLRRSKLLISPKWCLLLFAPFALLLYASSTLIPLLMKSRAPLLPSSVLSEPNHQTNTTGSSFLQPQTNDPYHDFELFDTDYREMLLEFKIFVYPFDAFGGNDSFASVFLPHPNPFDPKIGNYYSEHAFKIALLNSPLATKKPEEAHLFFMPFSINAMRNHPLLRSESTIPEFVSDYVSRIGNDFPFWNLSEGADHFFACCHSVGREAASKHFALRNNAVQLACSSSYFQRLYSAHRDVALPQIWPREVEPVTNPPSKRDKLVFYAGRLQNSRIRQELLHLWGNNNDSSFSIFPGRSPFPYIQGFKTSRYCIHVKGYEVNTARISDAIHYGCVPVIISDYYDLPFSDVLDWSRFSIVISHGDVAMLGKVLRSVSEERYLRMYENLGVVRRHFRWHDRPLSYDAFYMTAYQLWLRRGSNRLVV